MQWFEAGNIIFETYESCSIESASGLHFKCAVYISSYLLYCRAATVQPPQHSSK